MSAVDTSERIAIQDVMLTYAAAVDERDLARYRSCFAEDVEVVGFGEGSIRGVDTWVDYVAGALDKYQWTQHMLSPVLARIEGDCADARTDVQAVHLLADGNTRFTLWATYLSRLQRSDKGWRISRHELVVRGTHTD